MMRLNIDSRNVGKDKKEDKINMLTNILAADVDWVFSKAHFN